MGEHDILINERCPMISTEVTIAAAHFVHTAGAESPCVNLHGHNWRFIIEIQAQTQKDSMVVDFRILKKIINELDHKTLVPRSTIVTDYDIPDGRVIFRSMGIHYDLPEYSCVILDIPATTAEELAKWAVRKFAHIKGLEWSMLAVTVYESEKSYATFRIR